MIIKSIIGATCALMLATSTSNAAYIDSNTGLRWLELTETQNQSYNTVIGRITGGDLSGMGWRYATGDEFDTMVTGFGTGGTPGPGLCSQQEYCGWSTENNGLVTQLLSTFGDLTGLKRSYGILADFLGASHRTSQLNDMDSSWESATMDYINTYDTAVTSDRIDTLLGSYLVSEVPLPGAAWLFGSGLIGLIGLARRKKA